MWANGPRLDGCCLAVAFCLSVFLSSSVCIARLGSYPFVCIKKVFDCLEAPRRTSEGFAVIVSWRAFARSACICAVS